MRTIPALPLRDGFYNSFDRKKSSATLSGALVKVICTVIQIRHYRII